MRRDDDTNDDDDDATSSAVPETKTRFADNDDDDDDDLGLVDKVVDFFFFCRRCRVRSASRRSETAGARVGGHRASEGDTDDSTPNVDAGERHEYAQANGKRETGGRATERGKSVPTRDDGHTVRVRANDRKAGKRRRGEENANEKRRHGELFEDF